MPNSICNIAVDAEAEIAYVSEHNALNALHLSNGQELWRQSFPSINRIERILPDDKLLVSLERRSDFNPVFGLFDTKTREFIWAHQDEKFGDTCYRRGRTSSSLRHASACILGEQWRKALAFQVSAQISL
jgi:hypothetical protein